ncbi:DTW domain-containing protein [Shewanella sp. NFH-SH190041]|uniref:tRNA-uridine aminocarboxypropyltransferase n=1 Tax=Shewanella sp. NFH-SH190041 TaxID=2950245 RepID=UPI0021C40267|nr:tRNA-uridine aminocarboxypropyltransferase [Shewanella sp. NFH-SH190041]BDM65957.1 DTW domain-containing protein [Shewanella sp. NFH-SH190041]
MSKRRHCLACDYPENACLCAHIDPIVSQTQVVILQHPAEAKHAKNSVRLLRRVLPQAQVYLGESADDFAAIRAELSQRDRVYLLYPSAQSEPAASVTACCDDQGPLTLVLLDATWRKALKMFKLNPWLQQLPALHLGEEIQGRYTIRKASRPDSLSTLEATAYCLAQLEPALSVAPLFRAFDALIEHRLAAMPALVRQRYSTS